MQWSLTRWRAWGVAMTLGAVLVGQAYGFADDEARRAILDLREQVKVLKEQLNVQRNAQMNFMSELTRLGEQNRKLTGQIEELTNALNQEKRQSRSLTDSLNDRLGKLEPSMVEYRGQVFEVQPQEKRDVAAIFESLRQSQYGSATKQIQAFLSAWPKSGYAQDLTYWLGISYFQQKQYQQTITVQNRLIRLYPKGDRVPEAMLSVGAAQAELGNKKAALATYKKVIAQFPNSPSQEDAQKRITVLSKRK